MIKVHLAGCDNDPLISIAFKTAGVNYRLFTCYPFIKNKRPGSNMKKEGFFEPHLKLYKHTIMDSGLFTLMFGSDSGVEHTPETIYDWQLRIIEFVKANDINATIVECDCQKLISPDYAWGLRRELKQALPDKQIMNVFHLPDGQEGFDKLVEFSDYIAISVPELRISQPTNYRQNTAALTRRAKKIKPSIKIHLLGCTEISMLKANSFCTSSDSSSWNSVMRFGKLEGYHVSQISDQKTTEYAERMQRAAKEIGVEGTHEQLKKTVPAYIGASHARNKYTREVGDQS